MEAALAVFLSATLGLLLSSVFVVVITPDTWVVARLLSTTFSLHECLIKQANHVVALPRDDNELLATYCLGRQLQSATCIFGLAGWLVGRQTGRQTGRHWERHATPCSHPLISNLWTAATWNFCLHSPEEGMAAQTRQEHKLRDAHKYGSNLPDSCYPAR
ncbi:hypothetical protein B0T17DRAFT_115856 [Bombardia bombarda]|uniref:Uncharacterized protein n=1 Tax=Bombardia bombarda TaxID=252184 RepID=A0AA39TGV2_9PEZI|nr:hypothetical protein B0T17DRAFT_115856 [Bombardia bombarda]